MYDSDIGFGIGGKGILKNRFHKSESFDLILFGSSKGEQWYVFTFSMPDFEIRQGTVYPLALDLKILYNKFLKSKFRMETSTYQRITSDHHIIALRLWMQDIRGQVSYEELSKIGDSWTGRGFKAARFLDKAMMLASAEYRFLVYRTIGGVLFTDTGRVWPKLSEFSLKNWHSDGGVGLRYYLTHFVVRLDVGFSREGTRIFFNFGHVF